MRVLENTWDDKIGYNLKLMVKKLSKSLRHQKTTLIVGLCLIVTGLGWMLSVLLMEKPQGEFVEGEHYQLLENPRRLRGDKIEVMEFFSYACVHCYNFDPDIEKWAKTNATQVRFVRTPLYSNELWERFARAFFTFKELGISEQNHYAFFAQLHGAKTNLITLEAIANWVDGRGTTAEEFTSVFNSAVITNKLKQADRLQRRLQVATVPTLIVNGKYRLKASRTIGPSRMLDVLDFLVAKEQAEKLKDQQK